MEKIICAAYAKINIGLDVIRKREDGYHEVDMVMQTLKLADEVMIEKIPQAHLEVECVCKDVPADESNLIARAARGILDYTGRNDGLRLSLKKNIPVAAGLGGGSADAAAILRGINILLNLGLGGEELHHIAKGIGADVPYLLEGGACRAQGIGECLSELKELPKLFVVLLKPTFSVSTKKVYEALGLSAISKEEHPDMDAVAEAIEAADLRRLSKEAKNLLESVTQKEFPMIGILKAELLRQGAELALMSGSGSTVFGLFSSQEEAQSCAGYFSEHQKKYDLESIFLTETITKAEMQRMMHGQY